MKKGGAGTPTGWGRAAGMARFSPGARALFRSMEIPGIKSAFHAASIGDHPRVAHLNARDDSGAIKPITGTVLRVVHEDKDAGATYVFQPDGWDVSNGVTGFEIGERYLDDLPDGVILPVTYVTLPLRESQMEPQ